MLFLPPFLIKSTAHPKADRKPSTATHVWPEIKFYQQFNTFVKLCKRYLFVKLTFEMSTVPCQHHSFSTHKRFFFFFFLGGGGDVEVFETEYVSTQWTWTPTFEFMPNALPSELPAPDVCYTIFLGYWLWPYGRTCMKSMYVLWKSFLYIHIKRNLIIENQWSDYIIENGGRDHCHLSLQCVYYATCSCLVTALWHLLVSAACQ